MMGAIHSASRRRQTAAPESSVLPTPDNTHWYVSTTGNDTTGAGTLASPYLTLQKAVTEASSNATRKTIFMRGGTYRFTTHIYLASAAANLKIYSYPNEDPIISGGEVLTGFASEGNGLYSKATTQTSLDLIIGGKRQKCAQSGALDPASPFATGWLLADGASTLSTTNFRYRGTELPTGLMQTGLMVQVPGGYPVGGSTVGAANVLTSVTAINDTTKTITFSSAAPETVKTNAIYRVLNHPALIRNAGEFAWRQSDGKLVVKPESASFESQGVVVPRTQYLFQVDNGADNIQFAGLTFANVRHDGAAFLMYGNPGGDNLRIGGCTIKHCGNGLFINGATNTTVAGCVIEDIADAGIALFNPVLGTKIYNNKFRSIGYMYLTGSALYSGGGSNTRFRYNDVWGTGQYAASFKGAATTGHSFNDASYNHIRRTNRFAYDTAAIESLNRNRQTLNLSVIGNNIDDPGGIALSTTNTIQEPYQVGCVYLDDLSSDVTIRGNFMRGALWGHVFIHGGDRNLIENNYHILMPSEDYVSTMHNNGNLTGDLVPDNNTFQKNIYYSPVVRTGQRWNINGLGTGNVIDNNVYYNMPKLVSNPTANLTAADVNSVVSDPLFNNFSGDDFVLQGASPAFGKGIVNLDWEKMGTIGYTEAAATADTLPRFWSDWSKTPKFDGDYRTRLGLVKSETFARTSVGSYYNSRSNRVSAVGSLARFDHDPSSQQPRGILIEPQRTNLIANSDDLTSASWTKTNTTAAASGGIGLDGANSLSTLTKTTEQGEVTIYVNTFASGSALTATAYLKRGNLDWVRVALNDNSFVSGKAVWFNLSTGAAGAAPTGGTTMTYLGHSITYMGRGIYCCVLSVQTNTITDASFQISGDIGDGSYWGTVGGTVLLDAAQVEAGTTPTSLIPTTSGPVTRQADTLDIPLANGTYDIFVEDAVGSEWRNSVSVTTGSHRVLPRTGMNHVGRVRAWQTGAIDVPPSALGPESPTAWTASTGAQTGEVFVKVTDLPDPGDGAAIGDTLGEITSADVEVNGGSWTPLQPVRMTDLPLWVCIDLNKAGTVWANTAGTTPAVHGSVVARIDDARGTGAFYLTGGSPVYQIVDGRRFLLCAALDLINLPLDLVQNRSAVSVITSFRSTSTAGNLLRTTVQGSTSTLWLRTRVNSGVCNAGGRRLFADTLASNDIVGQDVVNDDVVFTSIFNLATANLKCRLNKTQHIDTTFQTAGNTENLPAGSATLLQDTFAGRFYGCAIGPLLTTDQISAVEHEMLHNMEFLV